MTYEEVYTLNENDTYLVEDSKSWSSSQSFMEVIIIGKCKEHKAIKIKHSNGISDWNGENYFKSWKNPVIIHKYNFQPAESNFKTCPYCNGEGIISLDYTPLLDLSEGIISLDYTPLLDLNRMSCK